MPQPFCSVEFATLGARPDPVSARVIRAGFSHEILILRFRDRNMSSRNYRTDMPIAVSWGIFPSFRQRFVGYVHHVTDDIRRETGESRVPTIEVTAVGATRVFRDAEPKNWGATRTDRVAHELARVHKLGANVDRSPVTHNNLMQPSQSAWSFLGELARDDGLHLSTEGTRVLLWNVEERARDLKRNAPVFDYARNEVTRFQPVSGEMNASGEDEAALRSAYTLSRDGSVGAYSDRFVPVTNSLTGALAPSPRFGEVRTGAVLTTPVEAREHLQAIHRRTARVYKASADLMPLPRLRPADWVVFENYGDRQSGYWFVDRVEFSLSRTEITSKIEVSREETHDNGKRPETPGGKSRHRRPWNAALVNGAWVDRSRP